MGNRYGFMRLATCDYCSPLLSVKHLTDSARTPCTVSFLHVMLIKNLLVVKDIRSWIRDKTIFVRHIDHRQA